MAQGQDSGAGREMTGAEMVLQAFKDNGVKHVFGYPGGAVLPIYDQIGYNGLALNLRDVRTDARGSYRWLYDAWFE